MIQHIVFDIGNVLVRWDPAFIIAQNFSKDEPQQQLTQQIFKSQIWLDLNLGIISEIQAVDIYQQKLGIERTRLEQLMESVRHSLIPLPGSFELLKTLYEKNFNLYALTDNTKEIMKFLKQKYNFWPLFKGVVVSAEVGYLKPAPEIYKHLLQLYKLHPEETVFIDDLPKNIEGAKKLNMHGIQFENLQQCIADLRKLQIIF